MRGCGRLGGIFNNNDICLPISLNSFSSFESLGFIRNGKQPFFCALIYRPPKADTDFIQDFSEFLLFIRVKYDKAHILGDLRIRGCCPYLSSSTAKCIHLYQSFNFEPRLNTDNNGHVFDLVLPYGVSVNNCDLLDFSVSVSNHKLYPALMTYPEIISLTFSRTFNSSSASRFSKKFLREGFCW